VGDTRRAARSAFPAGNGAISRLQIVQAIPAGSRRARSQKAWLREVLADDELTGWRIDKQRHWSAMIRGLAAFMDWKTRCTRPTWDLLAEWGAAQGRPRRGRGIVRQLHKSTVARCLRWLAARGYLGVVESGSIPDFRPMALRTAADGNLAAVYVLTTHGRNTINRAGAPRIDAGQSTIATPSFTRRVHESPRTRARERTGAKIKSDDDRPPGGLPLLPRDGGPRAAAGRPEKRAEGERAARQVQDLAAVLGGLSPAHVAHLARLQLAAGWTPADVVYALDHHPGGRSYGFTAAVRHPAAWARSRLAAWLDPGGVPLPSASQVRAAAAAATTAGQAAWRAELEAARASRVDPAGPAQRARALLAARGGQVARDLARHRLQRGPA
jgi:hypothetical protein